MIISNFLSSASLLGEACRSFNDNCVVDIKANHQQIQKHLHSSLMLVTALTPHVGYEKAAQIVKAAHENGSTLREEAVKSGALTSSQFDRWVIPEKMVGTLQQ